MMNAATFQSLMKELESSGKETLDTKNDRYADGMDRLHNFRVGANISGRTPAQTCWGYLTKHLVALRDMVDRDDFTDRDDFLEKCQDSINYIKLLWCIGNDGIYNDDGSTVTVNLDDLKRHFYDLQTQSPLFCDSFNKDKERSE